MASKIALVNHKNALIVIDFINEIVDKNGKLASKGYGVFVKQANTFEHLNKAISSFKAKGYPVVFVKLGFDNQYSNLPKSSPVFGKANEFGILKLDEWSTQIHPSVKYEDPDITIQKERVSAFYNTNLESMLHEMGVTNVFIAGVATDLTVESTARDAHDRDFIVTVISDACAAATMEDHNNSLRFLKKIGSVITADKLDL